MGTPIESARGQGQVWWKVRHPRGCLGRAVHHEQVEAALLAERGVSANRFRVQPSPGLGQVAQLRQVKVGEPDAVEQVERVWHACERRAPRGAEVLPEHGRGDRLLGEQQGGAHRQVAVEHRQAIAVVQGQRRRGDVRGPDAEVLGDGGGVGSQVGVREADQLGRSRGARRGQQHGEVRVQVVNAFPRGEPPSPRRGR